jgi:hypothetical protein
MTPKSKEDINDMLKERGFDFRSTLIRTTLSGNDEEVEEILNMMEEVYNSTEYGSREVKKQLEEDYSDGLNEAIEDGCYSVVEVYTFCKINGMTKEHFYKAMMFASEDRYGYGELSYGIAQLLYQDERVFGQLIDREKKHYDEVFAKYMNESVKDKMTPISNERMLDLLSKKYNLDMDIVKVLNRHGFEFESVYHHQYSDKISFCFYNKSADWRVYFDLGDSLEKVKRKLGLMESVRDKMTPKKGAMVKVRKALATLAKWLLDDKYFDTHQDAMEFIRTDGIDDNIEQMLGLGMELDEIYLEVTQFNMDEYLYNKGLPLKFAFEPKHKDDENIVGSDAYNRKHHMFYYETPESKKIKDRRWEQVRRHLNLDESIRDKMTPIGKDKLGDLVSQFNKASQGLLWGKNEMVNMIIDNFTTKEIEEKLDEFINPEDMMVWTSDKGNYGQVFTYDKVCVLGKRHLIELFNRLIGNMNEGVRHRKPQKKTPGVDIRKFEKISERVLEKYPYINRGGCGVFAKVVHELTGLPYMLIIDTGLLDDDPPIHVMIKLPHPDGRLYDGEGIKTKSTVREEYRYDVEGGILFLEDSDGSIFDNYYTELGSGLFTHNHHKHYDDIYEIVKTTLAE